MFWRLSHGWSSSLSTLGPFRRRLPRRLQFTSEVDSGRDTPNNEHVPAPPSLACFWMEDTSSGGFYTPLHWVVLFLPCSRLKFRLRTFSRNGSELRVAGLSAGRPCPPPRPFSWREWPGTKRWLEASLSLILRQNTDFRTVMGGNWPGESRRCFRWPMKATNDPGNVFSNLFQMLELVVVF